jgi:hypothetical protein
MVPREAPPLSLQPVLAMDVVTSYWSCSGVPRPIDLHWPPLAVACNSIVPGPGRNGATPPSFTHDRAHSIEHLRARADTTSFWETRHAYLRDFSCTRSITVQDTTTQLLHHAQTSRTSDHVHHVHRTPAPSYIKPTPASPFASYHSPLPHTPPLHLSEPSQSAPRPSPGRNTPTWPPPCVVTMVVTGDGLNRNKLSTNKLYKTK